MRSAGKLRISVLRRCLAGVEAGAPFEAGWCEGD
jgi:hypothetical protein